MKSPSKKRNSRVDHDRDGFGCFWIFFCCFAFAAACLSDTEGGEGVVARLCCVFIFGNTWDEDVLEPVGAGAVGALRATTMTIRKDDDVVFGLVYFWSTRRSRRYDSRESRRFLNRSLSRSRILQLRQELTGTRHHLKLRGMCRYI